MDRARRGGVRAAAGRRSARRRRPPRAGEHKEAVSSARGDQPAPAGSHLGRRGTAPSGMTAGMIFRLCLPLTTDPRRTTSSRTGRWLSACWPRVPSRSRSATNWSAASFAAGSHLSSTGSKRSDPAGGCSRAPSPYRGRLPWPCSARRAAKAPKTEGEGPRARPADGTPSDGEPPGWAATLSRLPLTLAACAAPKR